MPYTSNKNKNIESNCNNVIFNYVLLYTLEKKILAVAIFEGLGVVSFQAQKLVAYFSLRMTLR